MRDPATGSIERQSPAPASAARDRLAEVICLALAVALLTLAGRIIALW